MAMSFPTIGRSLHLVRSRWNYSPSVTEPCSVHVASSSKKHALFELLGAEIKCVPDSRVRRAGDDDPLVILQTQHRARVTSQYLQTLQRLLIPDL